MRYPIALSVAVLAMAALPPPVVAAETDAAPAEAADENAEAKEPSLNDRVYFFEHRLLPRWTHESGGAFFEAMLAGDDARLREAATEIVNAEFAAALRLVPLADGAGVLLAFAAPQETPECYYILIRRHQDSFRYYTLEQTHDLFERGMKSVVGEWTADGRHHNYGSRTYTDQESFIAEIAQRAEKPTAPGATMDPGG